MCRRLIPALIIITLAGTACSSGPEGVVNELLDQVRLGDPLATRTYQENQELLESSVALPALLEALATDPSPEVRQWCVRLLGRIGDEQALSALAQALSDDNHEVREGAATALSQIGEEAAEDAFIEALASGSREAKIMSIVELEKISSVKAIPALAAAAHADDGMISRNATDALGGIGDPSCADPLVEIALNTGVSEALRRSAILNLGRMTVPEASAGLDRVIEALDQQEGAGSLKQLAEDEQRSG